MAACIASLFVLAYVYTPVGTSSKRQLARVSQDTADMLCYTVPVGQRQTISLSDGSKIFANSRTTVFYPKWFRDGQREVVIKGEALVDVVHDDTHPFVVKADGYEIYDVGTKFLVNTYDANDTRVVLVEGIVDVKTQTYSRLRMRPGQMARLANSEICEVSHVDVNKYLSWSKGYLQLDGETFGSIIIQLNHYYGCHIVCQGRIGDTPLYGKMVMQKDVHDVIESLRALVSFKMSRADSSLVISGN